MTHRLPYPKARKGFTLVELAVVIVIIGVLAAFGVPRFLKSVERSKASEAFAYLAAVRSSQERYLAQYGEYSSDVTKLDIQYPAPAYFAVGAITATQSTWTLTLTRTGASAGYGAYTVTFTDQGYDTANSTISTMGDINPISNNSANSSGGSGGGGS
ncbi:type IV pilin protein [Aquisphaera insulae]|uniref:type IV pilin protein n=1 Tax=Aquisphaera insulae TaxID=2712864 RepID=UPI0013EB02FB|nr:prepilin-type N-terminal cleavage/methylation domain-containing protein [Aquisphaera insulae]